MSLLGALPRRGRRATSGHQTSADDSDPAHDSPPRTVAPLKTQPKRVMAHVPEQASLERNHVERRPLRPRWSRRADGATGRRAARRLGRADSERSFVVEGEQGCEVVGVEDSTRRRRSAARASFRPQIARLVRLAESASDVDEIGGRIAALRPECEGLEGAVDAPSAGRDPGRARVHEWRPRRTAGSARRAAHALRPDKERTVRVEGAFELRLDLRERRRVRGLRTGGSGDRIRTCDLRVMSPTSYRTAPPRTEVGGGLRFMHPRVSIRAQTCEGLGAGPCDASDVQLDTSRHRECHFSAGARLPSAPRRVWT